MKMKVMMDAAILRFSLPNLLPKNSGMVAGSASGVTFSGYDESVVAVNDAGEVEAVGLGQTVITASTFNGKRTTCAVTVKDAPEGVALAPKALTIGAGESAMLQHSFPNDCAGSYAFTSDDVGVVRVNDLTGVVTGVAAGTANVTVTTYNGLSDTCAVQVTAAPTGVRFQERSVTVSLGDSYQLLEPVLYGENAVSALTYTDRKSVV